MTNKVTIAKLLLILMMFARVYCCIDGCACTESGRNCIESHLVGTLPDSYTWTFRLMCISNTQNYLVSVFPLDNDSTLYLKKFTAVPNGFGLIVNYYTTTASCATTASAMNAITMKRAYAKDYPGITDFSSQNLIKNSGQKFCVYFWLSTKTCTPGQIINMQVPIVFATGTCLSASECPSQIKSCTSQNRFSYCNSAMDCVTTYSDPPTCPSSSAATCYSDGTYNYCQSGVCLSQVDPKVVCQSGKSSNCKTPGYSITCSGSSCINTTLPITNCPSSSPSTCSSEGYSYTCSSLGSCLYNVIPKLSCSGSVQPSCNSEGFSLTCANGVCTNQTYPKTSCQNAVFSTCDKEGSHSECIGGLCQTTKDPLVFCGQNVSSTCENQGIVNYCSSSSCRSTVIPKLNCNCFVDTDCLQVAPRCDSAGTEGKCINRVCSQTTTTFNCPSDVKANCNQSGIEHKCINSACSVNVIPKLICPVNIESTCNSTGVSYSCSDCSITVTPIKACPNCAIDSDCINILATCNSTGVHSICDNGFCKSELKPAECSSKVVSSMSSETIAMSVVIPVVGVLFGLAVFMYKRRVIRTDRENKNKEGMKEGNSTINLMMTE